MTTLAERIMNNLWPVLGGNHTDAETWQQINDAVAAAMQADAAPVVARVSTSSPIDDRGSGNTSDKLRDAVEVFRDASDAATRGSVKYKPSAEQAAAAVIEADRQATRAALIAEIVAWMRGNCMSGKWRVLASEIEEKWSKL